MALLALVTAGRVEIVGIIPPGGDLVKAAAEAIVAGAPVTQDAAGKWINSDGNGVAPINTVQAIALRSVAAGESLTAMRKGRIAGYNLDAQAYGARIFVSDTVGILGDIAGTASLPIGFVEAATGNSVTVGHDKVLHVDIPA